MNLCLMLGYICRYTQFHTANTNACVGAMISFHFDFISCWIRLYWIGFDLLRWFCLFIDAPLYTILLCVLCVVCAYMLLLE